MSEPSRFRPLRSSPIGDRSGGPGSRGLERNSRTGQGPTRHRPFPLPYGTLAGIGLWAFALTGCGLSAPGRPDASINGGTTRQGIGLAPSGNTPSTDMKVGRRTRSHTAHGHGTGPGTTIGKPAGHAPPGVTPGRAPSTGTGSASGYSGTLGLRRGILGAGPAGSGTGTTIPNRMGSSATGRNAGVAFGTQGGGVGGVVTRSTPGQGGNGEAPQAAVKPSPTSLGHTGAVGTGLPVGRTPVRSAAGPGSTPVAQRSAALSTGLGARPSARSAQDSRSMAPLAAARSAPGTETGGPKGTSSSKTSVGASTGRPADPSEGPSSPYADPRIRAAYDRTGGAHREHMGVYHPPAGHRTGAPLSTPSSLSDLPAWSSLVHYNGSMVSDVRLTPWVANMGYHYGHKGPGLILMRNNSNEVVAAETGFPASKGWEPWYDQPQGKPADTIYSEHLYFVAPASITPTMSNATTADLSAWSDFQSVNANKTASYTEIGPDPGGRAMQEGPPGFGIRVLVTKTDTVAGLVAAWPSNDPQGWRPWFDQPQGKPITDPTLGSVYTQHLWLVDPRSLP